MALSKKNITILIILVAVAAIAAVKFLTTNASSLDVDPVAARVKGPAQAKINIVEFIDFECPACAYGAGKLKEYMEQHPADIRLEIKYYPLMNMHHHALQVASYAECISRQGRFWPFFDPLMSSQAQWSQLVNAEGVFDQLASGAGADMGKLKSCLSSGDVSTIIMNEKSAGSSLGVKSTPTYFINKKMIVGSKSMMDEIETYYPKTK